MMAVLPEEVQLQAAVAVIVAAAPANVEEARAVGTTYVAALNIIPTPIIMVAVVADLQ